MSLVNVKYNNEVLFSTNKNKTITLKCKDKMFVSDLEIEILEETLQYEAVSYAENEPLAYQVVGTGTIIDKEITVPSVYNEKQVTTIGKKAFEWSNITSITLGRNVTIIDDQAFYCCMGLKSIDLKRITSIGKQSFESCRELKELHISNALVMVEKDAFIHCDNLKTIYFYGSLDQWKLIKDNFPSTVNVVFS